MLVRRYKRFLADVHMDDAHMDDARMDNVRMRTVTAFCANTGSMLGLREPGTPVLLSPAQSPGRRTRWTLEAVRAGRTWVGVNTHLTNRLAAMLMERGLAKGPLSGCRVIRPEVTVGNSRLDFLAEDPQGIPVYVEVKSVTLRSGEEAQFPDAVTARGARHLAELAAIATGQPARRKISRRTSTAHATPCARAVMLYLVQRSDCRCFATADDIDPGYGEAFRAATGMGVEAEVHLLSIRRNGIYHKGRISLCHPQ